MQFKKNKLILFVPLILAIIAVVFIAASLASPKEQYITGMVETKVVDVSSKIPGRIDSIFVDEGEKVSKGTILAKLESKEIDAKVGQARSAMEAAKAKLNLVKEGARKEEKEAVEKLYNQAKHQYEYAKGTYERFKPLYKDSLISKQTFDEIQFKYNAAKEQMEAAKAKYDMVQSGARPQQIDAVQALYHQAENAYKEAMAYRQELQLKAPIDGEVYKQISEAGEVIAGGYPIFTLMEPYSKYVVIQLREDKMSDVKMGKRFKGKISALGNITKEFEVNYIAPMADFATWKPTNQKGEFDLKTFEIRLKPVEHSEGLRPGMTVNFQLN